MSNMFESLDFPLDFDPPLSEEMLAMAFEFGTQMANEADEFTASHISPEYSDPYLYGQGILPGSSQSSYIGTPFDLPDLSFDPAALPSTVQAPSFSVNNLVDFNQPHPLNFDTPFDFVDFTLLPEAPPSLSNTPSPLFHAPSPNTDNKQSLPCPQCHRVFTKHWDLNRHVKRSHVKPFICNLCPRTFGYKKDLARHIDAVHAGESSPDERTGSNPELKDNIKMYKCEVKGCQYKTSRKDAFKRHGVLKHKTGM